MTHRGRSGVGLWLLACGTALGPAAGSAPAQGLAPFGARATGGWRLAAGVGEQWESNIQFASTDQQADLTTRARLEGARLWRTTRDRVTITGSGSVIRFRDLTELNRTSYDAALQAMHDFTSRTNGVLDYHARSDLTSRSITPVGEGPLLRGLVAARTHDVTGALAHRLTRSMTTSLGAEYQHVAFDSPDLVGGELAASSLQLSRVQSRATTLSLNYDFRHSRTGDISIDAQQLGAAWDHRLTQSLGARLNAGASTQDREHSPRDAVRFVGGALLRLRDESTDWSVEYQRSVGQEFGLDDPAVSTIDLAALRYQRLFLSRYRLSWGAMHAWSAQTAIPHRSARSLEGVLDLRYELRRGLAVAAGAFYRRREDPAIYSNRGVTFGLGYAWSQIRSISPAPQPEVH